MRATFAGLAAVIILGAIGLIVIRSTGLLNRISNLRSSPSPSASITPNFELAPGFSPSPLPSVSPLPSPSGSPLPTPSVTPSTKGGVVEGDATSRVSTSTSTSGSVSTSTSVRTSTTSQTTVTRVHVTVAKTDDCPSVINSEIKDISASLSLQYRIRSGYSAAITVWNENGSEISGEKVYTGDGKIMDTGSAKSIKIKIQPRDCSPTSDTWLEVFATR